MWNFDDFVRKREAWIKQARRDVEPKLSCEKLVELEEAMQHYSDEYNAVITVVPRDGSNKHMVFTPSVNPKLSDVLLPKLFNEMGE